MFLNESIENKINNNRLNITENETITIKETILQEKEDSESSDIDKELENIKQFENNSNDKSIISSTIKERNSTFISNSNYNKNTSLFISEFDFNKALEFILNYVNNDENKTNQHTDKKIKLINNDGTNYNNLTNSETFSKINFENILNQSFLTINNYLIKNQITSKQINILLNIIIFSNNEQSIIKNKKYKILKLMKPKEMILDQDLKKLISSFNYTYNENKSNSKTYSIKLGRWLVMNLKYLNESILHSHYQLFFNYLKDLQLGRIVVDILIGITKKQDVKQFRIKWLLSVSNQSKFNFIIPLLKVYQSIDPINVIFNYQKRQVKHDSSSNNSTTNENKQDNNNNNNNNNNNYNININQEIRKNKFNYLNIKNNINQFKINIQNIILPNKISGILENEYSVHLLSLSNCFDPSIIRFKNYLSETLQDLTFSKTTNQIETFLNSLCRFLNHFQQESIEDLDLYLINYLRIWDGQKYQYQIFQLLERINIYSFEYLYSNFLKPLHKLFSIMDITFKFNLIKCYSKLLLNWLSNDWLSLWLSTTNHFKRPIFTKINSNVEYFSTVIEFSKYFDQLSIIALIQTNDHPIIQHFILDFYTTSSQIVKKFNLGFTITPSIHLFRKLYLSNHSITISRLSLILTNYSIEFTNLKSMIQNFDKLKIKELKFSTLPNFNNNIQTINNCFLELIKNLFNNQQQIQQQIKSNNDKEQKSQQQQQQDNKINLSLSIYNSIVFFNYYNIFKSINNMNHNNISQQQDNYIKFLRDIGHSGLYNLLIKIKK